MRAGDGPREISAAGAYFVGVTSGDTVLVTDVGKLALHVFAPDLRWVESRRFRSLLTNNTLVQSTGEVVFAGDIRAPARAGQPLHVSDRDGAVLRSFGRSDPGIDPRLPEEEQASLMLRSVAPSADGAFWSSNFSRFHLEKWTVQGQRIVRVNRARDGWYGEMSRSSPGVGPEGDFPLAMIKESREPNLLWLLYGVKNATPISARDPLPHGGLDLIVEAVDTRSWQVLARRRFDSTRPYPYGLANAPDRVAIVVPINDVFTTVRISRLNLIRPSGLGTGSNESK